MQFSTSKILTFALVLVVMVFLIVYINKPSETEAKDNNQFESSEKNKQQGTLEKSTGKKDPQAAEAKTKEVPTESAIKISKLQDLMDEEETIPDAMKLALEMARGDVYERMASLSTFEWVGGRDSVRAIIPMLSERSELATRARQVLSHIFAEEQLLNIPVDAELWEQALNALGDEAARNEFLIILTGYPDDQSVPVLIKLFDSEDESMRTLAREYMESIAEGTTIENRQQAEAWFEKHKQEQAQNKVEE